MRTGAPGHLVVDDLRFELRWSSRRRTIEITVERDASLVIKAPPEVPESALVAFVREKKFWIYTKLTQKEALKVRADGRDFVSGEGFLYLGRSYRLLLVEAQEVPIKLEAGRFKLRRADAADARNLFIKWYTACATKWLTRRVEGWAPRMGVSPTGVEVRDLGFRWGSCGQAGRVNFHWATIQLPPALVDYVIVHELAHLVEPNHTDEFWQRVRRALPDYEPRKQELAAVGAKVARL